MLRLHLTTVRMAVIKKTTTVNTGREVNRCEGSYTAYRNTNFSGATAEVSMETSQNKRWPSYTTSGYFLKGHQENKDTFTAMFIEALFIIAKSWNQPKRPTTEESVRKLWYMHTMEVLSAIKRKEVMSSAGKWVHLEIILLGKFSQL